MSTTSGKHVETVKCVELTADRWLEYASPGQMSSDETLSMIWQLRGRDYFQLLLQEYEHKQTHTL